MTVSLPIFTSVRGKYLDQVNKAMEDELKIPDLVAYALFETDERASQFALPLQMFLASLALFEAGSPLGAKDLLGAVCELLPSPDIDGEAFDKTVAQGVKAGFFQQDNKGDLSLGEQRLSELQAAAARLETQREQFHSHIRACVETELSQVISADDARQLMWALERYLQQMFHAESVALAKAFGPDGKGFDMSVDGIHQLKLATLVNSLVPSTEKLRRKQYQMGISEGLLLLVPGGRLHLATIYQKTVAFALLHQDPNVQKVKRRLAQRRVIYLDTNVVMAWMFAAHRAHTVASEVAALAGSVKCTLQASKFTLEELDLQLKESDQQYQRIAHREGVLAFVNDDVIRSYRRRKDAVPNLAWQAFLADFRPPRAWLEDHGVVCDDHEDWANAVQDDRKDKVFGAVQAQKKSSSPPQLINFDVHNILYTLLRRKEWRPDEMGNRVWFVTLDRSLSRAEASLVKQGLYGVPASHGAEEWCEFLGPYAVPESPELEDYVTHLVQSRLGLLREDPRFVDTNFLVTLEQSNLDIDGLLSSGPARAHQVLIALQESREVARLVKATDEERKDPKWGSRLDAAVSKALKEVGPDSAVEAEIASVEKQRDEALRVAEVAKKERDGALRRWTELDQTHRGLEERLGHLEEERAKLSVLRRAWQRLRRRRDTVAEVK
jgi:hypothetical protein